MNLARKLSNPATSNYTEVLKKISLFTEIKDDAQALETLGCALEEKRFAHSGVILKEGETGSQMYFLIAGDVSVFKNTPSGDMFKVALLKGDQLPFFGEAALLDEDARSATIKAETDCHCLVLTKEAFAKFSSEHPQWALPILSRVARVVMGRLRKANNDFTMLYNALVNEVRGS